MAEQVEEAGGGGSTRAAEKALREAAKADNQRLNQARGG
jgi:hypothetical protein